MPNKKANSQKQRLQQSKKEREPASSGEFSSFGPLLPPSKIPEALRMFEFRLKFPKESADGLCYHASAVFPACVISQLLQKEVTRTVSLAVSCDSCYGRFAVAPSAKTPGAIKQLEQWAHAHATDELLWLCLTCGHIGCGRSTTFAHALSHSKLAQSTHALAYNVSNGTVWCYRCDTSIDFDELPPHSELWALRKLTDTVAKVVERISSPASRAVANENNPNNKQRNKQRHQQLVKNAKFTSTSAASSSYSLSGKQQAVPLLSSAEIQKWLAQNARLSACSKGLANLGNTCFFNSIMQNIVRTAPLYTYLLPDGAAPPRLLRRFQPPVGEGPLTHALRDFFLQMWWSASATGATNPRSLFTALCAKVPRFRGYAQQDAHEALRELLEGVQSEENRRLKKIWLASHPDSEAPPREFHTFVDEVFGGKVTSTVTCHECGTTSTTYETMLDLSIPFPRRFLQTTPARGASSSSSSAAIDSSYYSTHGPGKRGRKAARQQAKQLSQAQTKIETVEALRMQIEREKAALEILRSQALPARGESKHQRQKRERDQIKNAKRLKKITDQLAAQQRKLQDKLDTLTAADQAAAAQSNQDQSNSSAGQVDQTSPAVETTSQVDETSQVVETTSQVDETSPAVETTNPVVEATTQTTETSPVVETSQADETSRAQPAEANEAQPEQAQTEQGGEPISKADDLQQQTSESSTTVDAPTRPAIETRVDLRVGVTRPELLNVTACVFAFTLPELLSGENGYRCVECTRRRRARDNASAAPVAVRRTERAASPSVAASIQPVEATEPQRVHDDDEQQTTNTVDAVSQEDSGREAPSSAQAGRDADDDDDDDDDDGQVAASSNEPAKVDDDDDDDDDEQNEGLEFGKSTGFYFAPGTRIELKASYQDDTPRRDDVDEQLASSTESDEALARRLHEEFMREEYERQEAAPQSGGLAARLGLEPAAAVEQAVVVDDEMEAFRAKWMAEIAAKNSGDSTVSDAELAAALAAGDVDDATAAAAEAPVEALADVDYSSSSSSSSESEEEMTDLVITTATKQMLLHKLPRVLNIHLKRFAHTLTGLKKIGLHVDFPLQLDLTGFCDRYEHGTLARGESTRYELFGTVQHSGTMGGGHYIAYVMTQPGSWSYFSDSTVRPVSVDEVLSSEAYILFYRQVDASPLPPDFASYQTQRQTGVADDDDDDDKSSSKPAAPASGAAASSTSVKLVTGADRDLEEALALSLLIQ